MVSSPHPSSLAGIHTPSEIGGLGPTEGTGEPPGSSPGWAHPPGVLTAVTSSLVPSFLPPGWAGVEGGEQGLLGPQGEVKEG